MAACSIERDPSLSRDEPRQVSWAPDGKSIHAAVADVNADIVLLDGLI
jgi:hypothetical protein